MFCGECGAPVNASDASCSACGAKVHAEARPKISVAALKTPGFGVMSPTRRVLHSLSEGKVIRSSIATILQIGAVLTLLLALVALVMILKYSFQLLSAGGTIGGIILAVLMVVALFAVAQIYLFRAQSVRELGDSPFTVIPILSILFRAAGETYAIGSLAWGMGGCLFIWLSGMNPMALLANVGTFIPNIPGMAESAGTGGTFLDGLIFLVGMVVGAFVALVVFYALAELVVVIVDIAINVRKIEGRESEMAQAA